MWRVRAGGEEPRSAADGGRRSSEPGGRYSRKWAEGRRHVRVVEVDDGHELTAFLPRIIAESDDFLGPWGVNR